MAKNNQRVEVVLKVDLHCKGCARTVVKAVRSCQGVESVRVEDIESNKVMVIGEVDPDELRQKVEEKINKKVELISPAKKKVKFDENVNQFGGDGVTKDKIKFPVTTTVLKVSLDCYGCIKKIQQIISKTEGFKDMSIDTSNNLVAVKGTIDVNALTEVLEDKLNRKVEIVSHKEDGGGSGGKKKGKGGGVAGEGKESGGRERRMEEHKMENFYIPPGQYVYPQYVNRPDYMYNYIYATHMFNEENPNACVVM